MENKALFEIKKLNIELKDQRRKFQDRLNTILDYKCYKLKIGNISNGTIYYKYRKPDEKNFSYIGNESKPLVRKVMEARYLAKSIELLDADISLIENFLKAFEPVSFKHVNSKLPKTYRRLKSEKNKPKEQLAAEWKARAEKKKAARGTFREHELIHRTNDGTMVRSKSEMAIYNYLLDHGYIFVYELPVDAKTRTFYPDFAILSEIDYKTVIYIEHQGMMSDPRYKDSSEVREFDYWENGFLPNRDVYFTYDDNKGGFDMSPIVDILRLRVRPVVWEQSAETIADAKSVSGA